MPLQTFPTLPGLGWDVKKRVLFSNNKEVAKSGAEFSTANWTLPMFEFDYDVNFMSQSDRDALEAFYIAQLGDHLPFLLSVVNDNAKAGASLSPAPNGTNKNFVILGMPAQSNVVGTPTLRVNGGVVTGTVDALGAVVFTNAPANGSTLSIDYSYAYVVKFKDKLEINQMMAKMYETKKITFRTHR